MFMSLHVSCDTVRRQAERESRVGGEHDFCRRMKPQLRKWRNLA